MKTSHQKPAVIGSWRLIKQSWALYRAGFKNFVLIVLVVSLPVNILNIWLSVDASFSVYASLASVIMNLALIYAVLERLDTGTAVTLREAYYDGTRAFVRFVLVGMVILAALVPSALGLFIFSLSLTSTTPPTLSQALVVTLLALIVALPSFWLIPRWVFALILVVDEDARPVAALKASRRRSLGRFWKTLGRLFVLGLFMLLLATVLVVPPAILAGIIPGLTFVSQIFQTLFTMVGLPLTLIYLVLLSRNLVSNTAEVDVDAVVTLDAALEPEPIKPKRRHE